MARIPVSLLIGFACLGMIAWLVRDNILTEVDRAPVIPCDESQWKPLKTFDRDAWLKMVNREQYVEVLKAELIGRTRNDVEALLGQPTHHAMRLNSSEYGYLLGRAPFVSCPGVLSQWFAVEFGEDSKVKHVRVVREY
jgi:hypothetical protein